MDKLSPYLKAIVGAIVAGLNVLYQALDNGALSGQEWIATAIAVLTTGGVVFSVPNRDPNAEHQDESVQPPNERGDAAVTVLVVVAVVILVLILAGRL